MMTLHLISPDKAAGKEGLKFIHYFQDAEHGRAAAAAREPLGRVVINLADFAAEDGRATQAFVVACSKAISAAVGEAKLLVTIG
jgi:hypothetical protein